MALQDRSHARRHIAGWFGVVLALTLLFSPASAQDDVERLEELKAERETLQQQAAAKALEVDVATASYDELADALDAVNALVDLQEARLADTHQAIRSAEVLQRSAEQREVEIDEQVTDLAADLTNLAVSAFTGEGGANSSDLTALLVADNPTEAARRRSLIQFQTGSLADGLDNLKSLVAEAEVVSAQRAAALAAAEEARVDAVLRAAELDDSRAAQSELVADAEARLEARLSEAAFLGEQDAAKASEIQRQETEISNRIRRDQLIDIMATRPSQRPPVITPDDIVNVQGINIHVSIAGDLEQLLNAARADGVNLSGWGFRDPIKQVELRQANCGESDHAIWDMPAAACNPPTARPGQSRHEQGLAVDFTYNGASMTSRSGTGFVWLQNNAHRFGFVNLPSEPWHWSNT